jgi:hypothetical protein
MFPADIHTGLAGVGFTDDWGAIDESHPRIGNHDVLDGPHRGRTWARPTAGEHRVRLYEIDRQRHCCVSCLVDSEACPGRIRPGWS